MQINQPFWKAKPLQEMTEKEWESICCRCGICCLHRLYHPKKSNVFITQVACGNLDLETGLCKTYEDRFEMGQNCKKITFRMLPELTFLPATCGYRTLYEKRDLAWWHPLISGNPDTIHYAGISIKGKNIVSEDHLIAGELLKYMLFHPFKIPSAAKKI